MKKVVALTLAAVAVVGLVGCNNTSTSQQQPTTSQPTTSAPTPTTSAPVPTTSVTSTPSVQTPTTTVPVTDYDVIEKMDMPGYDDPKDKTAVGKNGVATSQSMEASKIAIEVLNAGGNAFDAGIAAAFAISVTNPWLSGIGGGGYMVAYNASTGKAVSYDYREIAPAGATDSRFTSGAKQDGKAAGVPGWLDGMFTAFEANSSGKFTIAQIIEPARKLAEEGFEVFADHESNLASGYAHALKTTTKAEADEMFINPETLATPAVGETWRNPVYARTLAKVQAEGRDAIYAGEIAQAMVDSSLRFGGVFTLADVRYAAKATKVRDSIEGEYKNYKIVSMAPSSSGGIVIVEMMNMMEQLNYKLWQAGYQTVTVGGKQYTGQAAVMGALGATAETFKDELNKLPASAIIKRDDPNFLNAMAVALQLAYGDRYQYIADMDQVYVPISGLISDDYAQTYFNMHYRVSRVAADDGEGEVTLETAGFNQAGVIQAWTAPTEANDYLDAESLFGDYNTTHDVEDDPETEDVDEAGTGRRQYWKQFGNPCKFLADGEVCPAGFVDEDTFGDGDVPTPVTPAAAASYGGGTTHLSVADKDGNMVSMTQTVNGFWGNGIFPAGAGFPMNNEMNDFSTKESGQSELAYSQLAGAVKPFKRPLSSMSPTVVLEKDSSNKHGWKAKISIGASGARNIPVGVFNNIINILDYGMDADTAAQYTRIGNETTASPNVGYIYTGLKANMKPAIEKTITHAKYVELVEKAGQEEFREGDVTIASYYNPVQNADGKHELIDAKFEAKATANVLSSTDFAKVQKGDTAYRFMDADDYKEVKAINMETVRTAIDGQKTGEELRENKIEFGLYKGTISTKSKMSTADWMVELGYYINNSSGGLGTLQSAVYEYDKDGKFVQIEAIAHYMNETNKALGF